MRISAHCKVSNFKNWHKIWSLVSFIFIKISHFNLKLFGWNLSYLKETHHYIIICYILFVCTKLYYINIHIFQLVNIITSGGRRPNGVRFLIYCIAWCGSIVNTNAVHRCGALRARVLVADIVTTKDDGLRGVLYLYTRIYMYIYIYKDNNIII